MIKCFCVFFCFLGQIPFQLVNSCDSKVWETYLQPWVHLMRSVEFSNITTLAATLSVISTICSLHHTHTQSLMYTHSHTHIHSHTHNHSCTHTHVTHTHILLYCTCLWVVCVCILGEFQWPQSALHADRVGAAGRMGEGALQKHEEEPPVHAGHR